MAALTPLDFIAAATPATLLPSRIQMTAHP
jgi:hypothetical protein